MNSIRPEIADNLTLVMCLPLFVFKKSVYVLFGENRLPAPQRKTSDGRHPIEEGPGGSVTGKKKRAPPTLGKHITHLNIYYLLMFPLAMLLGTDDLLLTGL